MSAPEDSIDPLPGTGMIQYIDVFQCGCIILAIAPELVATDGDRIGHAEIMKRTKELFLQCLWQSNLSSKTIAEICGHIVTVHSLRCSRQAEENLWGKVIEDRTVAGCGAMMGLIDYDVIVEVSADLLPQSSTCQHPYGTEQMLQPIGLKLADQQLPEVLISKNIAKGSLCLLEYFLTVGNKQKPGLPCFCSKNRLKSKAATTVLPVPVAAITRFRQRSWRSRSRSSASSMRS